MKTNMNLFKLTPALVLVGFMIGCGGNTASDNKSPKGDGKAASKSKVENNSSLGDGKAATDTANQPKATKFTPEMVKAAFEAAIKQNPNLFTEKEKARALAQMQEPKAVQGMTDELNENISGGKIIDFQGLKVDAITVEALAKGMEEAIPKGKKKSDLVMSSGNAVQLAFGLQVIQIENDKLPTADQWCDAILRDVGTLAVFYSPQHPDTAKLKAALPKSAKPEGGSPEDAEPSAPEPEDAPPPPGKNAKPKPLPKGERVSHYAFNKVMSGKYNDDPEMVLVFECDLGWNGAGGLEDALKYMDKFKLEKIAVATANFGAKPSTKEELKKLKWEITP